MEKKTGGGHHNNSKIMLAAVLFRVQLKCFTALDSTSSLGILTSPVVAMTWS